ncbi:cupin domain-containing protein [Nocardioides ferulae]|uniref:cupin domain-containing protein n=1 Tax=Nocardioides ferulae TaxID=2340821 RepID=UPI000F891646|nr:cupin domain-containing protein [Nocardioides ferulae]
MRVVVLGLAEGGELGEHESPWAATLQVLRGEVTLHTADEDWDLGPGELRCVPRVRHKVLARTPAVVLMTVALGG